MVYPPDGLKKKKKAYSFYNKIVYFSTCNYFMYTFKIESSCLSAFFLFFLFLDQYLVKLFNLKINSLVSKRWNVLLAYKLLNIFVSPEMCCPKLCKKEIWFFNSVIRKMKKKKMKKIVNT